MALQTRSLHVLVMTSAAFLLTLSAAPPARASLSVDVVSDSGQVDLLYMDESSLVTLNYSYDGQAGSSPPLLVKLVTVDTSKAAVSVNDTWVLLGGSRDNVTIRLEGRKIGRTELRVLVNDSSVVTNASEPVEVEDDAGSRAWFVKEVFPLVVSRHAGVINTVFSVVVIMLVVVAHLSMGCRLEADVIKATLKRPIAPAIGFLSQFLVMPVVSFALAYLLDLEPAMALGFLTVGSCPGGSGSNFWTFLLGGDVSLSVTITLVSTLASFGMLPLWVYTLGTLVLYKGQALTIPFENIFTSLLTLVVPVGIGFLVKWKKPGWAKYLEMILKPVVFIFILFILTVGIYANLYIFGLMSPLVLATGALTPYLGFFLGGLIAMATRRKKSHVITIAIETGIQNTGVAVVLLQFSLSPPESDLAIVSPIAASVFTPLPLAIVAIVLALRRRICGKGQEVKITGDNKGKDATSGVEGISFSPFSPSPQQVKIFHLNVDDTVTTGEIVNKK